MGHNDKTGPNAIPSCCNWVWSCCCCHCSGSVYVDNVVVQPPTNSEGTLIIEYHTDSANQNLYGNHLEKENLLDKANHIEANHYPRHTAKPYLPDYRDYPEQDQYDPELDRDCDSFHERMSLAQSEAETPPYLGPESTPPYLGVVESASGYLGGATDTSQPYIGPSDTTPPYLGSYQRIRHMSGLSDGPYTGSGLGSGAPYSSTLGPYSGTYRPGEGSLNGSFGSPDNSVGFGRFNTLQGRYRYQGGLSDVRTNTYELRSNIQRGERGLVTPQDNPERDDEEESAYEQHFKNEMEKERVAGEYRIPSVRNRNSSTTGADYSGSAGQGRAGADYRASGEFSGGSSLTLGRSAATGCRPLDYTGTSSGQPQIADGDKQPYFNQVGPKGETRLETLTGIPQDRTGVRPDQDRPVPLVAPGHPQDRSLGIRPQDRMTAGGNQQDNQLKLRAVSVERMDRLQLEMNPPADRWNLMYMTLILHGVGTLLPWNIFINAKTVSYYFMDYKLGAEYTNYETAHTPYFIQYIALAAHIPNLLFNWFNIFFHLGGCITPRIVWSLLVEILVMIFTIVLAMLDTSDFPDTFFYLSLASVVVLNMAGGIYQNTVYSLAARLPQRYTGAVVLGSNISGTVVSVINVLSIWISPSPRTAAIYYFITGLFLLLACFDTYFALPLNRYYRYNEHLYRATLQQKEKTVIYVVSYWTVFKKCFPQLLNIFLTYFITLTLFPAILSDIDRAYSSFFISKDYYVSVTCFLTFNMFAVIGNVLPSWIPGPSPQTLLIYVLLRLLYLPFFLLCNYRPIGVERLWPVLFHWDSVYWLGVMTFSMSGGFLAALGLMYCPRTVEKDEASVAGMFGSAAIGSGILAGVAFSSLMPGLISAPALDWELPSFWPPFDPSG